METIYALATAQGRGGIAVIRVSGPDAFKSLEKMTSIDMTKLGPSSPYIKLCRIINPVSRETIDRGLVLFFKAPASYTGEDVVEFHVHGGRAIIDSAQKALASLPRFRLAEPGEFTRRAFENGKMDLTAAEAVSDLVDAETEAQRIQALSQMEGQLSALYEGWAGRLTRALAHLEADIDFPDEDLPDGVAAEIKPEIENLRDEIKAHLDDNRRGERLREGVMIAVVGAPNAGKSSLVNALACRDVAIVSGTPGTTRDIIEVHLNLGGYPVIIADTAGIRTGHDDIETEGIQRALTRARTADIRILLFDATTPPNDDIYALAGENSVIVYNKADLANRGDGIRISALTGAGLDKLTQELVRKVALLIGDRPGPSPTRARHRTALEESVSALERALTGRQSELIAEDTRLAIRALGRITGRVDVEDLLDVIFRDFCIGK